MSEQYVNIEATLLLSVEGSVAVFAGLDDDGEVRTFAVDHRMAETIYDALDQVASVPCAVPSWALLS